MQENTEVATVSPIALIIWLVIVVFLIASLWKVFTKAGRPGWGAIIPFYNTYLMLKVAGKPGWWLILMIFIPIVNLILAILMLVGVARNFGKGSLVCIMISLLSGSTW